MRDLLLRLRRPVVQAAFVVALCFGNLGAAFACSCAAPPPYEQAVAEADAVLIGEVQSVRLDVADYARTRLWNAWLHLTGNSSGIQQKMDRWLVKLRVIEQLKGERTKTMELEISDPTSHSGVPFRAQERWLVFATSHKDPKDGSASFGVTRSFCGRTDRLPEADEGVAKVRAVLGVAQ